jgi:hypothetical protein
MRGVLSLAATMAVASLPPLPCQAADEPPLEQLSSDAIAACVSEHEAARIARLEERWLDSREAMQRCSSEACPVAIRSDCESWLNDLMTAWPSIVIVVERNDGGSGPVQVELDGKTLTPSELANPIEIVPGKHSIRFSVENAAPAVHEVVVGLGEKNRVVRARLGTRPRAPVVQPLPAARAAEVSRPTPVSTYILGAGAVAAFAVSGSLLASALSERSEARSSCAPDCDPDVRQSIETQLLFSDLSAGLGILLGGLSIYTYLARPEEQKVGTPRRASTFVGLRNSELILGGSF